MKVPSRPGGSGRLLAGALAQLLSTDSVPIASESTDMDGLFRFASVSPARYLIRVTGLDARTTVLGPLDPGLETRLGDLSVSLSPLPLAGIEVAGESVCGAEAEARGVGAWLGTVSGSTGRCVQVE